MRVCIVIPAHNEEKYIGPLVAAIRAKGLEVVVVDDGSFDATSTKAKEGGAVVLRNEPRQGKGYSLKRGFAYALENKFDGVIAMDGDGQHAVADLDAFLKAAESSSFCVANGTRMRDVRHMPFVRRVTNRFMSWMISRICGQEIEDTQCGFRYISGDVLKQLKLTSNDFEIETEVLLKSSRAGCKILSVPIQTIYQDEKSKIRPVRDTIRFFKYLVRELKASR